MPDIPINDPKPVPPVPPDDEDCCRSGCDPCIFDIHAEAMERYRAELQAWEQRQAGGAKDKSALGRIS